MNATIRILSLAAAALLAFPPLSSAAAPLSAETAEPAGSAGGPEGDEGAYAAYLARHAAAPVPAEEVDIPAAAYREARDGKLEAEEKAVRWTSGGEADWSVMVPADGLYRICLKYQPLEGDTGDLEIGLKIDGAHPFEEAGGFYLPRFWADDGEIRTDSEGGEYTPLQKQIFLWGDGWLRDPNKVLTDPLSFYLSQGEHTITLQAKTGEFQLAYIRLSPAKGLPTYAQMLAQHEDAPDYTGNQITYQGEKADVKSSSTLVPMAASSTANVTPHDPVITRLNYIGGKNWKESGQSLTWRVKVPASGFYHLYFKYSQTYILNGTSYRSLAVNGTIPFAEAASLEFPYSNGWTVTTPTDKDGHPYKIYLEEGEQDISLTVTLGPLIAIYHDLSHITTTLGDLYRKMTMIVGEVPDANRDYGLFRQIPEMEGTLIHCAEKLEAIVGQVEGLSGMRGGSAVSVMRNMSETLRRMLKYYWKVQMYKNDYYSNYGALSAWLDEIKELPLDLDEFALVAPGAEVDRHMAGVWEKARFSLRRFVHTFLNDYGSRGHQEGEEITAWVFWGRDQAQTLALLAREDFTKRTGISVRLQIVNASMIQAQLSGKSPDCVISIGRAQPVNLAMRGMLVDLSQLEGFDEMPQRFQKNALLPYEFQGGCYGLPDTQQFFMMFYRTDILEELRLTVPKTWEDLLYCATVIQRNNMQTGIPYGGVLDNIGSGGTQSLFPTLLFQYGGQMYNEKGSATDMASPIGVKAFTFLTDLYSKYQLPLAYDFYTRFRTGEMPLAIALHNQYAILSMAAPEISGRWAMAELPGVVREDGSFSNVSAATGNSSVILKNSKHIDASWEFLKWWTSADTQYRFSSEVESILGIAGRQDTPNVEAFSRMSWKGDGLQTLLAQWEKVVEIPEVPGSYFTTRGIDQAFWNVTSLGKNPRDMLTLWSKAIDDEIKRKMQEYHLN